MATLLLIILWIIPFIAFLVMAPSVVIGVVLSAIKLLFDFVLLGLINSNSNKEHKTEAIKKYFKANAVDMESAAIAQVAQKNNVPVVIIKNISDTKNDSAEKYAKNEEFYGKELAKIIAQMLSSDN